MSRSVQEVWNQQINSKSPMKNEVGYTDTNLSNLTEHLMDTPTGAQDALLFTIGEKDPGLAMHLAKVVGQDSFRQPVGLN